MTSAHERGRNAIASEFCDFDDGGISGSFGSSGWDSSTTVASLMNLDQLKPNVIVRGPVFPEPVQLITATPMGNSIRLVGKGLRTGKAYDPVLSQAQLDLLEASPEVEPFDGDAEKFRLGIEAKRLGLAYEYDPYFALSIARVDPLPHQLEAVYDYFLKLPRIRFLLADDPGAGKTIQAGLLLKELKVRGLVKRTLIVVPANLTFQWQREMQEKFREKFEVVRGDVLRANYGSNPFLDKDQVVTSVSWVSVVEDAKESLLRSHWDLVIVDEAHRMSAYTADKKTLAYQLGEALQERTDHYLMMTATPHKGDPEHFCRFLSLLDPDVYGDVTSLEAAMRKNSAPFYLRRTKEALVTFPDPDTGISSRIFTDRKVSTIPFTIDNDEGDLYDRLTRYVEDQSIKAAEDDSARGRALGFTMAMLQRRFASSIYALRRSLERMRDKREKILEDPEAYRQEQIKKKVPEDFEDLTDEEQQQIMTDLEGLVASVDPAALKEEILELGKLIDHCCELEQREVESKLLKLREVLETQGIFHDPKMKLLLFTEHKDTLDYLAGDGKDGRPLGKLREWGLTVTQIHGGMKIGDRDTAGTRLSAEREFRSEAQVLVATEAAGEGINLQFCWFMINYDIPWNPIRLEQRMGRIHRYGQEKDCLILNFVSTNTREGRVLEKLFDRLEQIERDLDPNRTGKVFNVLGDIFPSNHLEKMLREMYARSLTEEAIKKRIVEDLDTDRFRRITESTLEGLAKRELNLSALVGKSAEARENRLVPEVVEDFFLQAGPLSGVHPKPLKTNDKIYRVGRVPKNLWTVGDQLEKRFGKLGHEYKQIVFDKDALRVDPTCEWVTPGHPLFETVRYDLIDRVSPDLERGAVFFDVHSKEPYRLDVYAASIKDGRGNDVHRRLFAVQVALDGETTVRQPTIFLDLVPAENGTSVPSGEGLPHHETVEQALIENALSPFLEKVGTERAREVETIKKHIELSLDVLIDRQNLRLAELEQQRQHEEPSPLLAANIQQVVDRIDELNRRLDERRAELEQERHCMIGDIERVGRAWVIPYPEGPVKPKLPDEEIERIAVQIATAHEEARGWVVESVEAENRGFDLRSKKPHPADPECFVGVRFIEVKGRAGVGDVLLSNNEYKTAVRLKKDYWLYVVYDCATDNPKIHTIQDPARLGWEPILKVEHYKVSQTAIQQVRYLVQEAAESYEGLGRHNIVVEGTTDKLYLELAAEKHLEETGEDLLLDGQIKILDSEGTGKMVELLGLLRSLEADGRKFVAILDGDDAGLKTAEGLSKLGFQKNRHFLNLERADFRDKGGKSWDVEIEDLLPHDLVEEFVRTHPESQEAAYERGGTRKIVIDGKPREIDGKKFDYKILLYQFVRDRAQSAHMNHLVAILSRAQKCMGLPSDKETA